MPRFSLKELFVASMLFGAGLVGFWLAYLCLITEGRVGDPRLFWPIEMCSFAILGTGAGTLFQRPWAGAKNGILVGFVLPFLPLLLAVFFAPIARALELVTR